MSRKMKSQQQNKANSNSENHLYINKDSFHLPEANTKRWVASKKAEIIAAVRAGALTYDEACARYSLSSEEFGSWLRHFDQKGIKGLCTTKLKK